MRNNKVLLPILATGLALATAWAVRGRFGHEQGAAWAGAIGALCLLLAARRKDWYSKGFKIAFAGAFGWGISGMMSYGMIVGYGRAADLLNAFYGLLMLFVIGMLYGVLGGGITALSLIDSKKNRIPWASLLAEMVAIGLLTYGVLVNQLEWFMTPPRSELWACGLGASIALIWFAVRNQYTNVLKVALWAGLGAGVGFAFGNFLQVMGRLSDLSFNFWNVMEYFIGLGGGMGMAYGVFTSDWPTSDEKSSPTSNLIPILFVTLFVPFVVWDQSFVTRKLQSLLQHGGTETTIVVVKILSLLAILIVAARTLWRNYSDTIVRNPRAVIQEYFILYTVSYIFLSFLVTGVFVHPPEQYLYVVNLFVILWLIKKADPQPVAIDFRPRVWTAAVLISILVIAMLAFVAVQSHDGSGRNNTRFEIQ